MKLVDFPAPLAKVKKTHVTKTMSQTGILGP